MRLVSRRAVGYRNEVAPDSSHHARIELSPLLGWLFRSRPRALAISDAGLVVERRRGTTVVPWTEIESMTGGIMDVVARDSGAATHTSAAYELQLRGGEKISFGARNAASVVAPFAEAIVQRAGLEWVDLVVGGRRLPSVAVSPQAAHRLRANLSGR